MAAKKSKENPYLWANGTWHSRPEGKQYRQPAKPTTKTVTLPRAPAGSYDPALDAQERAAGRGLSDLLEDATRTGERETTDWILGRGDLDRQRKELLEDVETERQGVNRSFTNLGLAQGGQQRAAGLYSGGAAEQAAQKRAGNQQLSLDALLRQQQRGESAIDRGVGELNLGYQRAGEDRSLYTVPRAQREFSHFQQDLGESRVAQFLQGGGSMTQRVKAPAKKLPKPKAWNRRIRAQIGGV